MDLSNFEQMDTAILLGYHYDTKTNQFKSF
ncbi:MAG: hypothetical protein ACI9LG_001445 [Moritella dasanensis]|jgi:hypothetical protein